MGLVRPDNFMMQGFGNIFEQNIEDIWRSPMAQAYRQFTPNGCSSCPAFHNCRGGAKSVIIEHGLSKDRLMKEPLTYLPKIYQPNVFESGVRYVGLCDD